MQKYIKYSGHLINLLLGTHNKDTNMAYHSTHSRLFLKTENERVLVV